MNKQPLISIPPAQSVEELRQILVHKLQLIIQDLTVDPNNAGGDRVQNVARAIAASDAVPLGQVKELIDNSSDIPLGPGDYVRGAGGLRHVGVVTMVKSPGKVKESAITDDGTGTVALATRKLLLDNSQSYSSKKADGTPRDILWMDGSDSVQLRNGGLGIAITTLGDIETTRDGTLGRDLAIGRNLDVTGSAVVHGSLVGYYTKSEVDSFISALSTALSTKADGNHIHTFDLGAHSHTDPQGGLTGTTSLSGTTDPP